MPGAVVTVLTVEGESAAGTPPLQQLLLSKSGFGAGSPNLSTLNSQLLKAPVRRSSQRRRINCFVAAMSPSPNSTHRLTLDGADPPATLARSACRAWRRRYKTTPTPDGHAR